MPPHRFRRGAAHTIRRLVGFPRLGPPYYGRGDIFYRQQRVENERSYNEIRLTSFCMHNKGYELTPVTPPETAPTSPPPPPRSP